MAEIVQLIEKGKPQYLKTHVEAVEGLPENYSKKVETNVLWAGGWIMHDKQIVTPTKKITDCQTGWILTFQGYSPGEVSESVFHYFHIPKGHAIRHSGRGINLQISDWRGTNRGIKYVYVTDTQIKGHEMNTTAPNNTLVLTEVAEY